jgi:hypothetical protein
VTSKLFSKESMNLTAPEKQPSIDEYDTVIEPYLRNNRLKK